MSTTLIKISLLFQYLRVFKEGPMRSLCLGVIAFVCLWGFAYSFIAWVPCVPLARFWNPLGHAGKCWGYGAGTPHEFVSTFESHAGVNMVLDVLCFSIPIPLYFKRGTANRTRIGLLVLLFMGSV
jgi:Na+(H+)/acetate symporter ActP